MCNNNLLKATLTVALSLIVGSNAQADLFNVSGTTPPSVAGGTPLVLNPAGVAGATAAAGGALVLGTTLVPSTTCPAGQTNVLTITAPADWSLNQGVVLPSGGSRTFCLASAATIVSVPNKAASVTTTFATPEVHGGVTYALQMFDGTTSPTLPTLSTNTNYYTAVIYDTANQIADVGVRAKFELSDGVFSETPRLIVSNPQYAEFNSSGTGLKGGAGQKFVEFDIVPTISGAKVSLPLNTDPILSDWILLLYKVKNVTTLATETSADGSNALKMTFSATTSGSAGTKPVFSSSTVAIARSKSAIGTAIVEETAGTAFISVESGSKLFTTDPSYSTAVGDCGRFAVNGAVKDPAVSISDTEVQIGCVQFTIAGSTKGPDAATDFDLGATANTAGTLDDAGELNITANGQFAASTTAPGAVTFGSLSTLATDESTVSFKIKASDISTMTKTGSAYCNTATPKVCRVPITIKVDGATEINIQESKPVAELKLAFKDTSFGSAALGAPNDANTNAELRKIAADGKICTVWNVPDPSIQDEINIRVTNNSKAAGKLYAKMWDMSGKLVADNIVLADTINVKETLYFNADYLMNEKKITWTGRGVLEIRSSLSDIEVLAMLRSKQRPNAPLNNISLGAHGNSCNKTLTDHTPGF